MSRAETVLAALAAADAAEEKGDLVRAAELLRQVEASLHESPGRTLQGMPSPLYPKRPTPTGRYAFAVDAYTRRLAEPRSRRRA